MTEDKVRLIGSCPFAKPGQTGRSYINSVITAAKWAENAEWDSVLIYTNHNIVDPWLVAQIVAQNTASLSPLVAVQPLYAHPYTVANNISSLAYLYSRSIHINLVAGDFTRDRESFCDDVPHDKRYDRVFEYGSILKGLLSTHQPFSFSGEYYKVSRLLLQQKSPEDVLPDFMMSGSSPAGRMVAAKLGACAIEYPRPSCEYLGEKLDTAVSHGVRLGFVVRESSEEAWRVAKKRFPESKDGAMIREYSSQISDSSWVKALNGAVSENGGVYWLSPFKHYQSNCPYLVGSMDEVAAELAAYIRTGFKTFLIDFPENAEDARRITQIFKLADRSVGNPVVARVPA
jgi:alkanesulfonate monooxygenase